VEIGDLCDFFEQVCEFAIAVIGPFISSDGGLSESTEENSCYNDFLMAGIDEGLGFMKDGLLGLALNNWAGFGYNAIAAIAVAAILDFQKSAGMAFEGC